MWIIFSERVSQATEDIQKQESKERSVSTFDFAKNSATRGPNFLLIQEEVAYFPREKYFYRSRVPPNLILKVSYLEWLSFDAPSI